MFLLLAIVLFVLWRMGWLLLKTAGILIHLLLVVAVLALVIHLVSGRRG